MRTSILAGIASVLTLAAAFAVTNPKQESTPPPPQTASEAAPPVVAAAPAGYDETGFRAGESGLNESERAGREIWYKATAGNARFHTYAFQQRIGVLVDWYRVLNAGDRDDRFRAWGIMNDPSCCKPGDDNCPAKSLEETFGFDWCPGDDALLKFVGKDGYRDPACDFKDAGLAAGEPHAPAGKDQRQAACDLAFGTSTGALGIRKFPNPRFNAEIWRKVNGGMASWDGYRKKLADGSVEPPFLIGTSCGSCHIAFDPLNPPADPAHPKWENLKGTVGNQYTRMSELLGSGMPKSSLEWQIFAHARPGTTDTSAIPTDQVNNPGTINALIDTNQRPTFPGEVVNKWHKATTCAKGEAESACWCEPGRDGKCWKRSTQTEPATHHILKGGEDSVGALLAIQRVYFNIGSCSEQCWINHLTDMRQLDPQQRNFGQTPFNIAQCRRDCPNFRAIEDRVDNIFDFLRSPETRPTDLDVARENLRKAKDANAKYAYNDLVDDLEKEFGPGAVNHGKEVFAANCARCHSSIPESVGGPFRNRDYRALAANGLRADFMGNDQSTLVSEVGTFRCRALHSNHMVGHVYQEFASDTLRSRPPDPNLVEAGDGGRGYYRNISLLSVWAHAPFMHNNAIGPELCGKPANKANDFYRPRYVDGQNRLLADQPACFAYDPSVEGRFELFKRSMDELLSPDKRGRKVTVLDTAVPIVVGPRTSDGKQVFGFTLEIPQGINVGTLGNFLHKQFAVDLVLAKTRPADLEAKWVKRLGDAEGRKVAAELAQAAKEIVAEPAKMVETLSRHPRLVKEIYSSCRADVENDGHRFGESLSAQDKKALTAFLATL